MPLNMGFKQSKNYMLIAQLYVLGCFKKISEIFRYIWEEIVFLEGLLKLGEIKNV